MEKLFQALAAELKVGREAVLCTVIESSGSAPRGAGAAMALLQSREEAIGTIGGGIMEHLAQQKGRAVLAQRRSLMDSFTLSANQAASIGMVCGGSVRVFFQHCDPSRAPLFESIHAALSGDEDAWLVLQAGPEGNWKAGLYGPEQTLLMGDSFSLAARKPCFCSRPVLLEEPGEPFLFIEPLARSGLVYIFGGGHISKELVPVLAHLGFRPVVFEDRPQFALESLFPGALKVILGDFSAFERDIRLRPQDYIVIMTRGHMADQEVLEQALRSPAHYVGLIGSRSKLALTCDKLRAAGFGDADIARIHSPIGLPILAETPAEIAISIAAELIEHRARRARS